MGIKLIIVRSKIPLAHDLQLIIRGPASLRKAQTSLDTLQVLPGDLVAQDMGLLITLMQFLSSRTFVDTNHGNTNRPCTRSCQLCLESLFKGKTYAFPILSRR